MYTEKQPTQITRLDEAQVYTHLGWRWSLCGIPVLTLLLGLIPAAGYAMLVTFSVRVAHSGTSAVTLLVASIAAVAWQAPELLIYRGRRRLHPALWGLASAIVVSFGFTATTGRCLPWWPIMPLALAGGVGMFALEYKQTHPITPALCLFLLGPRVLSPFIGSKAYSTPVRPMDGP
jgi:hypothetical protein